MKQALIYQLKITIIGFKPPIWRRVFVSEDASFFELHSLIQDVFDWEDYHLHSFRALRNNGKKQIYIQDQETNDEWAYPVAEELLPPTEERNEYLDEHNTKLSDFFSQEFPKIKYEYDFGDSWEHQIELEKILDDPVTSVPAVVTGKRLGPPEDSRGWIHDAKDIVRASKNKRSAYWRELNEVWDAEAVTDFVLMSKDFLFVPFEVGDVVISDPKERLKRYEM